MTRVFLVDAHVDERAALHLLLLDLKMESTGKSAEWGNPFLNAIMIVLVRPLDACQQVAFPPERMH